MSHLGPAPDSPEARALAADDLREGGYVMDVTRLWAHHPAALTGLFELLRTVNEPVGLTPRVRALLTLTAAATRQDAYCALAWAGRLVDGGDAPVAAALLRGVDPGLGLDARSAAAVRWARLVARDPNGTTAADVESLREAGWSDAEVFAMTVHVALRAAFSMVNDALGAVPDPELSAALPPEVRDAVDFGRR